VDQPDLAASHFGSLEAACAFVRDAVERRLAALRRDFLDAATRTPMHGFVFALRHLLRQVRRALSAPSSPKNSRPSSDCSRRANVSA